LCRKGGELLGGEIDGLMKISSAPSPFDIIATENKKWKVQQSTRVIGGRRVRVW